MNTDQKEMPLNQLVYDLPEAEYHSRKDFVSNSWFKHMAHSPAHLRCYLDTPQDGTPAMFEGRVIHTAVLEPDLFDSKYLVGPNARGNSNAWKDAVAEALADGKELIKEDLHTRAFEIQASVAAHSRAAKLLEGSQDEVSGFWEDDGVMCKFRADALSPRGFVPDLKTTAIAGGAAEDTFGRTAASLGYLTQPAHYLAGLAACGVDVDPAHPWFWVVVETKAPYGVGVFSLTPELLETGQRLRSMRMNQIKSCLESGIWPGYDEQIKPLTLPRWAETQIENELENAA